VSKAALYCPLLALLFPHAVLLRATVAHFRAAPPLANGANSVLFPSRGGKIPVLDERALPRRRVSPVEGPGWGKVSMDVVRVSLPADPHLVALIDGAMQILNARGPAMPSRNALASAALSFLKQRTAVEALPAIRRFPPDRRGQSLDFDITADDSRMAEALFHHLSLSMPRGIPVVDWDPPHVLTAAVVLYCEHILAGPHLRLV
jgi:hypothetical protein